MNLTTLQQLLPKYQMATFCFQLKAIPPLNCIVNNDAIFLLKNSHLHIREDDDSSKSDAVIVPMVKGRWREKVLSKTTSTTSISQLRTKTTPPPYRRGRQLQRKRCCHCANGQLERCFPGWTSSPGRTFLIIYTLPEWIFRSSFKVLF